MEYNKLLKKKLKKWFRQSRINAVKFGLPLVRNPEKFVDNVFGNPK